MLTKDEKRQYKAIRAAVFEQDPEFKEQFEQKYPHKITPGSIGELVHHQCGWFSMAEWFKSGEFMIKQTKVRYPISGELAALAHESYLGKQARLETEAFRQKIDLAFKLHENV